QEDFDQIKLAFLRAQQIKAGLDAGFIREEDYVQARDSFLHSLDFSTSAGSNGPAPPPRTSTPPLQQSTGPLKSASVGMQRMSMPVSPKSAPPQPTPAPAQATGCSTPGGATRHTGGGWGSGTVEMPPDLPKLGKVNPAAGKRSMSGIGLSDQCVNIYNHIKTRKAYGWVTYKIDDAGNEVVVDQLGACGSSFDQFVAALPENECRYAIYDFAYNNADTNKTQNKLVFLHWAPSGSTVKSKMMYASTKDLIKGFMDGVSTELQADTYDELSENEMCEKVHSSLTRK
ncbi:hypothetical protein DUNSADRAFT_17451, partial [Dunaliella salina]